MTNKEFYFDKLLAVVLERACHGMHKVVYGESCAEKDCKNCEFYTVENIEKWLNAEHVEPELPLLENGDGLKPGDKIMVRDNNEQNWVQATYLFYFNEMFYCVAGVRYIAEGGDFINWLQARLPMEGE